MTPQHPAVLSKPKAAVPAAELQAPWALGMLPCANVRNMEKPVKREPGVGIGMELQGSHSLGLKGPPSPAPGTYITGLVFGPGRHPDGLNQR